MKRRDSASSIPLLARPDLILTGDWHLREDQPVCRTDDFWSAQWRKVAEIAGLAREYDCPVIHAGDLFNVWKPSPFLLSNAISRLPRNFHTIFGNHDLPQHSINLYEKSGAHTIITAGMASIITGGGYWGGKPSCDDSGFDVGGRRVLVWHVMTYPDKPPWPGCTDPSARDIQDGYNWFDLIVTGHNHQSFAVKNKSGNLLVNPGAITRQTADQADFKPCVYLWYAEQNEVAPYYLLIEKDVISREHLEHEAERHARIEAFISRLSGEYEVAVSFEENLRRWVAANKVSDSVMDIVWAAVEEEK